MDPTNANPSNEIIRRANGYITAFGISQPLMGNEATAGSTSSTSTLGGIATLPFTNFPTTSYYAGWIN
jgi:hypothetical protein